MAAQSSHPVILFDGVCNLCNGFVQFVIRHDKKQQFHFGALQTQKAQQLLSDFNLPGLQLKTIVLIQNDTAYTQSTAVLNIVKQLSGAWKLLYVFIIIPKPIRDWLYKRIAPYRYQIFGKKDSCMIPTPELQDRFLE